MGAKGKEVVLIIYRIIKKDLKALSRILTRTIILLGALSPKPSSDFKLSGAENTFSREHFLLQIGFIAPDLSISVEDS